MEWRAPPGTLATWFRRAERVRLLGLVQRVGVGALMKCRVIWSEKAREERGIENKRKREKARILLMLKTFNLPVQIIFI